MDEEIQTLCCKYLLLLGLPFHFPNDFFFFLEIEVFYVVRFIKQFPFINISFFALLKDNL